MSLTFSVVTPSYNQGQFIERTIQSVLTQSGAAIEYTICDGGSTDATVNILKRYKDRLRWVSELDDGQADAVNKGVAMTHGDIIAWLNSDDIYYPNALAKVAAAFEANPALDIVYGEADWIGENDEVLKAFPTEPWRYNRLKEVCFLCQPAVFFKRSMVDRYGGLDKTLQYCMDYELWLRYGQHAVVHFLPEKLAGSRMYASNKTMSQTLIAHTEINQMLEAKLGLIPANWLLGYALVNVEKTYGISRYDRTQTHRFVRLLVQFSCQELMAHNPLAFFKIAPKMIFWFLVPDRAWFRREDILALV
ncbi:MULTISPECIES: glycosyltransferase family 2 protein [Cyanophyceae]|uniref:glycosyltransferase family 2 protein n=1 Tax=Cyanophyceae TaxID=3028117 RepID=UPI0016824198|nr:MULTISPECIES: glycosyltransferase family 2 protein [Cyanophyceae]MBD1914968.1 glycosyltransferase [Phormidium sp. FACHB-77]MBD2032755.1 glycosyltransferase [Phormidium sp. FACHB-322]MBD2049900.1 glycosyltransferase [Leptolyngbya sp. FACHB-60]